METQNKWKFFISYDGDYATCDHYARIFRIGWRRPAEIEGCVYKFRGLEIRFKLPVVLTVKL